MTLKPGCGCLILVLSIMNMLLVALMAYGLLSGSSRASPQGFLMLLVFVSNVIVCFMVGLASMRSRRRPAATGYEEGEEPEEPEEPETSDTDSV